MDKLFITLLIFFITTVQGETLTGRPRVVDADTLAFGKEKVRIGGLDAPEKRQRCKDAWGNKYRCGIVGTDTLKSRIGGKPVTCVGDSRDRYKRLIGYCTFADGTDLNAWLVRQGHAVAYRKYSMKYVEHERAARDEGLGIWAGEFIMPWNWRRGDR